MGEQTFELAGKKHYVGDPQCRGCSPSGESRFLPKTHEDCGGLIHFEYTDECSQCSSMMYIEKCDRCTYRHDSAEEHEHEGEE